MLRMEKLSTELPVGVYHLDADDRFTYANAAWLRLHGFIQLEEIKGSSIKTVFVRPEEAKRLKEEILERGFVQDVVVELQKPEGHRFWASINAGAIYNETGEYDGSEGIITDITEREIHYRIAKTIPAGYYAVETINGVDRITQCNREFAQMFGFETQEEAIGWDISQFYSQREDFERFRRRIQFGGEQGVRNRLLDVQTCRGRQFRVETNINILRDHMGNDIGRVGVVRDLRDDEPLQKLRHDLGNVLHTFTTGLIAVKSDMEVALAALGPDPFPRAPHIEPETILDEMSIPKGNLTRSLAALVSTLETRSHEGYPYVAFAAIQTKLQEAGEKSLLFRAQALRDVARETAETCQKILDEHKVPRQPVKQVRQDAFALMGVFAQARLHERISDVLQMEHELRSLREVLVPASVARADKKDLMLWTLVKQSMNNLHDFAYNRGVEFRPVPNPDRAHIWANDREIMRVIANLLHNAIKYSWSRPTGTWIDIKLYRQQTMVVLEIENFGVPIPEDEIESEMVFQFGFRSRLATDRGRVGTGIGLADARQTLQNNGGWITINSRPSFPSAVAENLDPFLTTVTMSMPIYRGSLS
jgi:PAS domain S-box-containing protein